MDYFLQAEGKTLPSFPSVKREEDEYDRKKRGFAKR